MKYCDGSQLLKILGKVYAKLLIFYWLSYESNDMVKQILVIKLLKKKQFLK